LRFITLFDNRLIREVQDQQYFRRRRPAQHEARAEDSRDSRCSVPSLLRRFVGDTNDTPVRRVWAFAARRRDP
jgi:hypothetical protein